MRWRPTVALLALTACGPSTAERCQKIHTDALMNELLTAREERLGVRDTLTPPPPTPKDLAWSEEHCFRGKPR